MHQETPRAPARGGGPPTGTEVEELLHAAALAPSSHNTQPWRVRWHDGAVEVHGDPERMLPAADPGGRELRMACGAALVNVRLKARTQGRRVHAQLMPDPDDPWFLGRVRPGAPLNPSDWEVELAAAIPRRHTNRHPFTGPPLSVTLRAELERAAWRERCRLIVVADPRERRRLREITVEAHRQQRSDPAFLAEWERWVGNPDRVDDGLPPAHARRAPRPDDAWRPRDFAGAVPDTDRSTAPPEPGQDEPTIAVLTSYDDTALTHVRAGQAMQQVLLTATARGVGASFIAPPVELPDVRTEVRALLGGVMWPQVVLRLGRGRPVYPTPRRQSEG